MQFILSFVQQNGMLLALGLVVFLALTGRLNLKDAMAFLAKVFNVQTTPTDPSVPDTKFDFAKLVQLLLPLLLKSRASGDAATEEAIIKVMSCPHCKEKE